MTTASTSFSHGSVRPGRVKTSSTFCRQGMREMNWLSLLSYFFGGLFLGNAIPHLASGMMGRPFQSPFATPRGEGLSSSTGNVVLGFFNLVVSYLLVCRVGDFDLHATVDVVPLALGMALIALFCARHFG